MSNNLDELFKKQFIKFKEDKSYFKTYDWVNIKRENTVLVRFFKFKAPGAGTILLPDQSGNFKKESKDSRITNIAIVIKSNDKDYNVGDIVTVSRVKVEGESYTPDYMLLMQFSNSNLEPILPPNFREKASNLELNYAEHRLDIPWRYNLEEEDYLTYLLPSYEFLNRADDLDKYITI